MDEKTADPVPNRPPRAWFCAILIASVAVFYGLCHVAARYERTFKELEMRNLPAPTEGFLALAGLIRSPLGGGLLLVYVVGVVALSSRGLLDLALKKLIVLHAVGTLALIGFCMLSLHLPLAKISESLQTR